VPLFLSEAVESAKRPRSLHESKALNMGIAGLEPRQEGTRKDQKSTVLTYGVDGGGPMDLRRAILAVWRRLRVQELG
jgi:hypothetical protein